MAEKAFVRCEDYHAIQLVRQLREMTDKMKARAEVAVYLKRYDEAEAVYREIDRKDLAIQMRKRIGDYPRVVQLLQTGGGNDQLMKEAWDKIGEQYADKFKWRRASQYFRQSRNMERLAECLYRLEQFAELSELRVDIPDGTPLLNTLAVRFSNLGMHDEAVDCYIRCGNPKAAIDCCVIQNRWDKALELAEEHDFPQVEGLLLRYAQNLLSRNKRLEAVELYRRANRPTDSAILIGDIAEQAARRDVHPYLAKRLHVLSALEIERHRKKTLENAQNQATKAGATDLDGGTQNIAMATAATLESLMMTSLDTQEGATVTLSTTEGARKASKAFGNAWRGAAAYHYQMLAQKLFYA
ncbi:WDR35, partial [Symbiodinium microadriaticum]